MKLLRHTEPGHRSEESSFSISRQIPGADQRLSVSFERFAIWAPLLAILGLAVWVRFSGLQHAGAIFHDDLRAYSGLELLDALRTPGSWTQRLANAYSVCVSRAGGRPGLVLWMAASSFAGLSTFGAMCFPFAAAGVLNILQTWLLCRRWFDTWIAHWAALWLAVNAAHVNFSRCVLPPTPAITFLLLGLLLLPAKMGASSPPSRARLLTIGACFALATSFHPAYMLFLSLPTLAVTIHSWHRKGTLIHFSRVMIESCLLLALPVVAMILVPDFLSACVNLFHGNFQLSDLRYLAELKRLSVEPSIRGNQEGLLFLPKFLSAAHGQFGSLLTLALTLAGLLWKRVRVNVLSGSLVVIWVVVPALMLGLWPNLNSYGRLYAPILPGVACLAGIGTRAAVSLSTSRFATISRPIAHVTATILLLWGGIPMSRAIVDSPGLEPAVSQFMREHRIESAITFERTDLRAFPGMAFCKAYVPSEIDRCRCSESTDFLQISPPAFYLVLRHQAFLRSLRLEPVFVYANPYRFDLRAMEGFTPAQREQISRDALFSQLGLFRITIPRDCGP